MIDFETVLRLRQAELKKALREELLEMGYTPIFRKGFLYAPGELPVLVVAHLDTVHCEPPSIICYSKDGRYMMSPQGIGGDDRTGVYMILQILQRVNCHVLFCEDEESGGYGAKAFTKSSIKVNVNYIIELDRKGDNDAVYYGCDNREFRRFIRGFGFEEASGSFSDISILAPHLKTAAVNISAGYYNAHRNHEMIDTEVMRNNVERIIGMIVTPTDHFQYRSRLSGILPRSRCGTFFGNKGTDISSEVFERRLLMRLPEDTRLLINGHELISTRPYMMDPGGTVYTYIASLGVAVESEMLMACNADGKEIGFKDADAQWIRIVSYEEAIHQLKKAYIK